jgi:hypothetical protein
LARITPEEVSLIWSKVQEACPSQWLIIEALAAGAAYASAMMASPLAHAYANVIPALGVLFAGVVMLKGVFNKATAYLALAMGLTGILYLGSFFIDGLAVLAIVAAFLAMVFYLLVGVRLYKLGQQ